MLQVATFAVVNASAATVLASKLQSATADPSAFGSQLRAKGSLVFVESVEAPVVKTVVLPAPSPPVASPDVQAAPSPPAEPTIDDDDEGGGLFSTLADSFGSWQIYEYVSVGGAALLLCCCCVGCICRRRLRNCCARICPCCPCSRDSEGTRRRQLVQLSSSSLNAGSEPTEKQPRGGKKPKPKKEKKEKKEKAPKKEKREKPKRPKPHKGEGGASMRHSSKLPTMCVGVLGRPSKKSPHAYGGAAPPVGAPSDWEEFEDDSSGRKYWYNESTGDTTWEEPIELAAGRGGMPDRDSLVSCAAASPPALPPLPALGLSIGELPPEWEQHVDDTTGEWYWHNTTTDETTWEKPER